MQQMNRVRDNRSNTSVSTVKQITNKKDTMHKYGRHMIAAKFSNSYQHCCQFRICVVHFTSCIVLIVLLN